MLFTPFLYLLFLPVELALYYALPQLRVPRRMAQESFSRALFPLCWGFIKKLVIADQPAKEAGGTGRRRAAIAKDFYLQSPS